MAYRDFWSRYEDRQPNTREEQLRERGEIRFPIWSEEVDQATLPDDYVDQATLPEGYEGWGDGGGGGGDFPVFRGASRFNYNIGPAPRFTPRRFTAPTLEEAEKEPGYAFSVEQGRKALESSAAARGTLNTGGTLKGVLEYGQRLGQQNYQSVFNRALSVFDRLYQGDLDAYKPLLTEWSTQASAGQRAAELAWLREMDLYRSQIDRWKHQTPSASDIINLEVGTLG